MNEKMVLDPIFGIFKFPPRQQLSVFYARSIGQNKNTLAFTSPSLKLGLYAATYRPGGKEANPSHTHDFLEMVVVLAGRGKHVYGAHELDVAAGEIFFVNNQLPHSFFALSDDFEATVISFLPSAAGFDDALLKQYDLMNFYPLLVPFHALKDKNRCLCIRPDGSLFKKIVFHAFHLCELVYQADPLKRELTRRLLVDILYLLDSHPGQEEIKNWPMSLPLVGVLDYLHAHYSSPKVLKEITGKLQMSPAYFSTTFSKVMGRGPLRFITDLRIREADRLLKETKLPILEISQQVGYESPSHFARAYKGLRGKTPTTSRLEK